MNVRRGELLQAERTARGLSVRELARIAGLSPGTILRMEQGEDCRVSKLRRVADALGMSREYRGQLVGWGPA